MVVGDRMDQFRRLARQALGDLLDQRRPFGRLALTHVLMLAGDTLVAISLAGSLFFSISPDAAEGKVLLYLLLTLAPFAVVSPLLGPLIDRSRGARRVMAVLSAVGRLVICPIMAVDTHSLLLFPEAFLVLVLSKLYLVTRNALVPEMTLAEARWRRTEGAGGAGGAGGAPGIAAPGWRSGDPVPSAAPGPVSGAGAGPGAAATPPPAGDELEGIQGEYAARNARLTLLGTLAGFAASIPGVLLLELAGAPAVLIFAMCVFAAAAVAGTRLPVPGPVPGLPAVRSQARTHPPGPQGAASEGRPGQQPSRGGTHPGAAREAPGGSVLAGLHPVAGREVILGLTAISLIRGLTGFLVFLIAFGLRREHAALWWYGLALAGSGAGSLAGLLLVSRLRAVLIEQQILLAAVWLIAAAAFGAAFWGALPAQVVLALFVGSAGALAQPSFDALTQRFVPAPAQGRAFARFATRQQLAWVAGALVPVVIALPFPAGDIVMGSVAAGGGLFYVTSRAALDRPAAPEATHGQHQHLPHARRRAGPPRGHPRG